MPTDLRKYKIIQKIHEGRNTIIYRAVNQSDETSAIVKAVKDDYPTLEDITRLRHEYKILQNLDLEGIVKAYGLESSKNGVALILEEVRGDSLKSLMSERKIAVTVCLDIGSQLASILGELHKNQIVHKDIKPHNILIDPESWGVKLIDFSIATRLSKETQAIANPDLLEGTLAYMSPEQTGRMNRSIDYRSDFYSLGVTLYEILAGKLPFQSNDPLELVHCHIAKQPLPPHTINQEIPKPVSDIVMKLMAKNAEDRYQSAGGLKADFEICLQQLNCTGKIKNFIPGKLDKSGQLLIPQKLYGRDAEVESLIQAFERVSEGQTETIIVSGYSGIGKSALVNEIQKPIVRQRGYFISGKFDSFKRNIPYSALVSAFSELVRILLTESPETIASWKEKLLDALGGNGQVIIDVIPEVERIMGKQPPVAPAAPTEAQNRFTRVFGSFIQVFAQREHPLVIFLDDLQWADLASLKSIEWLMTNPDSQYLLTIGAYRDNEVSATHATLQAIEKIQKMGTVVRHIVLEPLNFTDVRKLVANTLNESLSLKLRISELAEMLFNKTGGNPFFLMQLLNTLYTEELLTFDFTEGRWLWDIEEIQACGIRDDKVVELVASNIQKLPEATQEILKRAACIGNQFNLDAIAIVNEKSVLNTAHDLWDALQAGLILPLSHDYKIPLVFADVEEDEGMLLFDTSRVGYKFLHDRVQQAAYSLISEAEKKATHLKIGQLLLQKFDRYAREENLFALVNQLNIGRDLIRDRAQKDELAYLNLRAGQKAKAATAHEAAIRYLNVGLELLGEESWQTHYDLTLALYVETVAAEYLNTNYKRGAELSETVLKQAKTLLEKVPVYEHKIIFHISQNQLDEAINTALNVLKKLGVSLPPKPNNLNVSMGLIQTKRALGRKLISDLQNLPAMTDSSKLAAMQILKTVAAPSFIANPALGFLVILTMVKLSIKYGNSSLAAFAYVFYGMILCGAIGEIQAGYEFGNLAGIVLDKFPDPSLQAKVNSLLNGYIIPWKKHTRETLDNFQDAIQNGLETGDFEYAGYSATGYCASVFFLGHHLELVAQKYDEYIELMQSLKQEFTLGYKKIWKQLILNLQETSKNPCQLIGNSFNEEEMLPDIIQANNRTSLFAVYFAKSMLSYLFKKYDRAIENAALAEKYAESGGGMMLPAEQNFYYSLALLGRYPNLEKRQQKADLKKVELHQKKMKKWALYAPDNYQHKYELVAAEKARVLGKYAEAMIYYDRAIQGAREREYIQEEALGNELAAEFYFFRGQEKIGRVYLIDAYYGYIRWGAKEKVADLETRYPHVCSGILKRENPDRFLQNTPFTNLAKEGSSASLDLATVMKASQAISGEIVLDKLLSKLMQVLIENAGARKGLLFLEKSGSLVLVAEKAVEKDKVLVMRSVPIQSRPDVPVAVINYVQRTHETVGLNNASKDRLFTLDPYIVRTQPKSILCMPLLYQGKLKGILYLENNLTVGAFTPHREAILSLLASQAAIALENAELYGDLQNYSIELENKNAALEKVKNELATTQTQLIQSEKMSSIGEMMAGIAHEINNPVNFIIGNITPANDYTQDLLNLLNLYQQKFPDPGTEIEVHIDEIDLDFIQEDLPNLLQSMKLGADRIGEIVLSLRNFSRSDELRAQQVDLHECLESTLLILNNRLKCNCDRPAIHIIKEYGDLPPVECYAGQLNQVFMNLIANAIDALEAHEAWDIGHSQEQQTTDNGALLMSRNSLSKSPSDSPSIRICTEIVNANSVVIRIADNGPGMNEDVRSKLFEPFFTTKPMGKGTGLGLSISHKIVEQKHGGHLSCISAPGEGAEFFIEIPVRQHSEQQAM